MDQRFKEQGRYFDELPQIINIMDQRFKEQGWYFDELPQIMDIMDQCLTDI